MSRMRAKIVAAVAICLGLGLASWRLDVRWHNMGRDAYLAYQAKWFDALYANLHPGSHFFWVGFVVAAVLAAYELLALLIQAVLKPQRPLPGPQATPGQERGPGA